MPLMVYAPVLSVSAEGSTGSPASEPLSFVPSSRALSPSRST
jgi:hypothetical protein